MVIINGIIHPVGGAVIQSGFVAWEGGRITAVGEMARLPQGTWARSSMPGAAM